MLATQYRRVSLLFEAQTIKNIHFFAYTLEAKLVWIELNGIHLVFK